MKLYGLEKLQGVKTEIALFNLGSVHWTLPKSNNLSNKLKAKSVFMAMLRVIEFGNGANLPVTLNPLLPIDSKLTDQDLSIITSIMFNMFRMVASDSVEYKTDYYNKVLKTCLLFLEKHHFDLKDEARGIMGRENS